MSGLGAWSYGAYYRGMVLRDARHVAGLRAFKQEVVYVGKGRGVVIDLPVFGDQIDASVRELQAAWSHTVNGRIGSTFARYLFWTRANRDALSRGIPNRLVHKLITLESVHDPVAQGFADDRDEGGAQIHMPFNPDVTVAQAWDPAFYIPFVADRLVDSYNYVGKDWDGAVAAHNVGSETARLWVVAGKPGKGRLIGNTDWFTRAIAYVALVKRQPVF